MGMCGWVGGQPGNIWEREEVGYPTATPVKLN